MEIPVFVITTKPRKLNKSSTLSHFVPSEEMEEGDFVLYSIE